MDEYYKSANDYLDNLKGRYYDLVSRINIVIMRSSPYRGMFVERLYIEPPNQNQDLYFFFHHAVNTLNHVESKLQEPQFNTLDTSRIPQFFVNISEALEIIATTSGNVHIFLKTFVYLLQDMPSGTLNGIFDVAWAIKVINQSLDENVLESLYKTPDYDQRTTDQLDTHGFEVR